MKCDLASGVSPNSKKCWLVSIQRKEDTAIGAVLGPRAYLEEEVNRKVEGWVDQVVKPAEFAVTYPQASYAVFT